MRALMVARFHDSLVSQLNRLVDPEFVTWDPSDSWSSAELSRRLRGFHILTTEEQGPVGPIDQEVLANAADLKAIITARRRPRVDLDAATKAGVLVFNMPGLNAGAVADLNIAFILLCARPVIQAAEETKKGLWAQNPPMWRYQRFLGFELEGATVGLIGFGAIGAEVARRLRGFGIRIVAYDPYISQEKATALGVTLVSLENLLKTSDFVSLHAPSKPENRNMLGAREFRSMKRTAYFINTARADLVEEKALYQALEEGVIAGAALDVFHDEPLPSENPLLRLPSVIITPHIGGAISNQVYHQSQAIIDTLRQLRLGEQSPNLFNPAVLGTPQLRYRPA